MTSPWPSRAPVQGGRPSVLPPPTHGLACSDIPHGRQPCLVNATSLRPSLAFVCSGSLYSHTPRRSFLHGNISRGRLRRLIRVTSLRSSLSLVCYDGSHSLLFRGFVCKDISHGFLRSLVNKGDGPSGLPMTLRRCVYCCIARRVDCCVYFVSPIPSRAPSALHPVFHCAVRGTVRSLTSSSKRLIIMSHAMLQEQ